MTRFPILARTVVAYEANGDSFAAAHRSPLADVTAPAQADQFVAPTGFHRTGAPLAVRADVLDDTGAVLYTAIQA